MMTITNPCSCKENLRALSQKEVEGSPTTKHTSNPNSESRSSDLKRRSPGMSRLQARL